MYPADSNFKLIKRRYIHYLFGIMIVSFALFFILAFFHVFSIHSPNASAISDSSSMSVNVDPNLSISSNDVAIVGTPDPNGSWLSGSSNIVVSTNNGTGYTLYMSSSSNVVDLVNSSDSSKKIYSLSSSTTENDFKTNLALRNHYGFTYDNSSTYYPITTVSNPTTIKTTHDNTNYDTTNVTFSTMADRAIPSGTYTGEVIFTAIANTNPDVFMQDFGTNECNALSAWGYDSTTSTVIRGDTQILWDNRDNQSYAVRKLADGNCWMVENFNLSAESLTDNGHSTTLDYTDTDLTQGTTFTVPATSNTNWGGDSYPVEPKIATSNVPSYTDYGMYYNWWAATARTTNVTTSGTNVSGSICPKGWHLPTGTASGELRAVLAAHQAAYGLTNLHGGGNNTSKINGTNNYANDTVGPNLQFSGYWNRSGTAPVIQSSEGHWWSSTMYNETISYLTSIGSSGYVFAGSNGGLKRDGYSVRCMLSTS